jgi:UDP-N-acetylglucosamine 2-epimerase
MISIATVVGARPQFVKASAVSKAIAARSADIEIVEHMIHTGQHYDFELSAVFFEELNLPRPTHELEVGSGSHGVQTGQMMIGLEPLISSGFDVVLVYGDTNSTLAGGLTAAKLRVPLAHVEAGLRSFDRSMPEELNRIVVDHVSDHLFCPSATAVRNLESEGITTGASMVGDVMRDVIDGRDPSRDRAVLERMNLDPGGFILATVHRAGTTDDPVLLGGVIQGLQRVARSGSEVVLPLHPRTRAALLRAQIDTGVIRVIDPLPYRDLISLEATAARVFTDSGGMQKEAMWLGVPCSTLRESTEWVETVDLGWNVLVGADPDRIEDSLNHAAPSEVPPDVYGDGHASVRIIDELVDALS